MSRPIIRDGLRRGCRAVAVWHGNDTVRRSRRYPKRRPRRHLGRGTSHASHHHRGRGTKTAPTQVTSPFLPPFALSLGACGLSQSNSARSAPHFRRSSLPSGCLNCSRAESANRLAISLPPDPSSRSFFAHRISNRPLGFSRLLTLVSPVRPTSQSSRTG